MYFNLTPNALIPSSNPVTMLLGFFTYLGFAGSILLGKVVPGVMLSDDTRLHYHCNGLLTLVLLVAPLGIGVWIDLISPHWAMADRGLELLSTTSIFSFLVTSHYMAGCRSRDHGSSLKPHVTGNLIHDWWFSWNDGMATDQSLCPGKMCSGFQLEPINDSLLTILCEYMTST
ncbi:unnamed protein product [Camellia sinensis]